MTESTAAADGESAMPDHALHDMIASHLDGSLDGAGQRRLAAELARSPAARRVLVRFLRMEAAIIRLAVAGQLGVACDRTSLDAAPRPASRGVNRGAADLTAPPASVLVHASGEASSSRQGGRAGRLRSAALALAGCLLAMLVASPFLLTRPAAVQRAAAEMDRLADGWLEVARHHDAEEQREIADAAGPGESPLDEEDDGGPPAWLVAAMGDEDMQRLTPDAG